MVVKYTSLKCRAIQPGEILSIESEGWVFLLEKKGCFNGKDG
jgi:hypothetical protein